MEYIIGTGMIVSILCMIVIIVLLVFIVIQGSGETEERVHCKQCIYFDRNNSTNFGLCRFNAPKPHGGKGDSAKWQEVRIIDWCGEGVKRDEQCPIP